MSRLTYFSIIVPVFNGAETLDACLGALVNQHYPGDRYEVIVVNDGSTDDTARVASQYPVRLINLETNQGRIVARNIGAEAARHETLVFNDVRVIPETQLLAKVSQRNYQPLIPNVDDYDGSLWGFARFFFLLRCKVYAPYYPLLEGENEFQITPGNFDKAPKGTGSFICNRDLWLACQPEIREKSISDDTRILRIVVEHRPILRTTIASVRYLQRTNLKKVVSHMFQRGPLFSDYYLRPGGRYYAPYLLAWLLMGSTAVGAVLQPAIAAVGGGLLLLLGLLIAASYLSQVPTDLIVVTTCLPAVIGSFGLGILKWQTMQLIAWFSPKAKTSVHLG
jgi:hypothetical protein